MSVRSSTLRTVRDALRQLGLRAVVRDVAPVAGTAVATRVKIGVVEAATALGSRHVERARLVLRVQRRAVLQQQLKRRVVAAVRSASDGRGGEAACAKHVRCCPRAEGPASAVLRVLGEGVLVGSSHCVEDLD